MVLGTIAVDTEVYIYVKNTFSGYLHSQEAISDNAGVLTLDLTQPDPSFYNQDSHYEVWVTLMTDNVKLTFTEDLETYDCLEISFYKVNDTYELP
jgi:hypothetical protein